VGRTIELEGRLILEELDFEALRGNPLEAIRGEKAT
jgi:hypothetical protein